MAIPLRRNNSRFQVLHRNNSYNNRRWKREVAMIKYALPLLVDLLGLKFQGKSLNPFDTHSCLMIISIIGLLLFLFSGTAASSSHNNNMMMMMMMMMKLISTRIVGHGRSFLGSLVIAILASLCLPRSLFWIAYLIFALASLDQLLQLLKCTRDAALQNTLALFESLKTSIIQYTGPHINNNDSMPPPPAPSSTADSYV